MFEEQAKGAIDLPDNRDFLAEHLFGDPQIEIPSSIDLSVVPSHKQGTTWHCTAYALTHAVEILNTLECDMQATCDPEEQWANQKYDKGNPDYMEKEGDSLQHALQVLLQKGLTNKTPAIPITTFKIDSYARIDKTVDSFRKYLTLKFPIYTGSGQHCYLITGFSDSKKLFYAKNSLKTDPLEISYNDIAKLFTPYIIYDKKDLIMIFKDVSENSAYAEAIKFCLEKGYMKGYGDPKIAANQRTFLPDKPLTRAEMAQILFNVFKNVKTI